MKRLQVQLTDIQLDELRRLASERGASIASIVRGAVDAFLRSPQQASRAELHRRSTAALGKFRSGCNDIAENHDKHLVEIYSERS